VNSACLALIDSGISMRCLFAAVNVAVTNDGEVIVDPGKGFFFGLGLTRFT
jgi:ribonuclease PH